MEIIVVAIVLGAITGTAFIRYRKAAERMRLEEGAQTLRSLYGAQKRHFIDNNQTYASNLSDLDITVRPSTHFNTPTVQNSSPLASIGRNDSTYSLSISDTAVISCSGVSCSSLGY